MTVVAEIGYGREITDSVRGFVGGSGQAWPAEMVAALVATRLPWSIMTAITERTACHVAR